MSKRSGSRKKKSKPKKKAAPKKPLRKKRKKPTTPAQRRKLFDRTVGLDGEMEEDGPSGFEIHLGAVTQEGAYRTIANRLNDAESRLPAGYEGRVLVHPYADGSVDGELAIKVPDDTDSAEYDLYEAFGVTALGSRYWISMGLRYEVRADDERYRRWRGLTQVETNYQRAIRTNIVEVHVILRNKLIKGMDKAFGMEAHSIFVRLHWNPEDRKPYR